MASMTTTTTTNTKKQIMFAILPPVDCWQPFVDLKSNHFSAKLKQKGKSPFPHITLVQTTSNSLPLESILPPLISSLTATLATANLMPLTYSTTQMACFHHGKRTTIYVKDPSSTVLKSLNKIQQIVSSAVNLAVNQKKGKPGKQSKKKQHFVPHIAIANVQQNVANTLCQQYSATWSNPTWVCNHVYVLVTDPSGPWNIHAAIPLHNSNLIPNPYVNTLTRLDHQLQQHAEEVAALSLSMETTKALTSTTTSTTTPTSTPTTTQNTQLDTKSKQ